MSSLVKRGDAPPIASGATTNINNHHGQYLTFMLSGEMYALGILNIKEIIEFGQMTRVPLMPNFIRGIINLRGRVVPVISLQGRFGKPETELSKRTCIVIIEVMDEDQRQDIGVVVDSVSEVLEIPAEQIEPAPAFGAKIRTDFISGMGKVNERFVIMLNTERILSIEEMSALCTCNDLPSSNK